MDEGPPAVDTEEQRVHDLRHTANILARGHRGEHPGADAPHGPFLLAAALRYQHAARDRDQLIAQGAGATSSRGNPGRHSDPYWHAKGT